jgi:putative ABC transport system permease protein
VLVGDDDYVTSQYDVIYGSLPKNPNQVVLITNSDKQVSDFILYSLGIRDTKEITEYFEKVAEATAKGEKYDGKIPQTSYTFEEICNYKFKVVLDSDYYVLQKGEGDAPDTIIDMSKDQAHLDKIVKNAKELEIVGILCPKEGAVTTMSVGAIGYTDELMTSLIEQVNNSDVVKAQLDNTETNLFTGYKFAGYPIEYAPIFREQLKNDPTISSYLPFISDEQLIDMINDKAGSLKSNLAKLGYVDFEKPTSILIYPKDFESKDVITSKIEEYNNKAAEKDKITYTDTVAMLMSSVTTIVNAISYVLIAFVAISLIVSSIMIGIITYISVLERTKEIGILRAIGASKRDVSRVFNAETLIVGFTAGMIGIGLTLVFNGIINIILHKVTGIMTLNAILPFGAAIILVLISMGLTLIAGLLPSRVAAKKDPVIALRSE